MTVGLPERLGRLPQGMVLAHLVRHAREDVRHGHPDRLLRVADHAQDRQPGVPDRPQERLEKGGTRLLEVGRPEHRPALDLADDPQLLVALLRLQPIEGQDQPAVLFNGGRQPRPKVLVAGPQQRQVDLQQVLDVPLGDLHRGVVHQMPPDLLARAVLAKAQLPDTRDHIEPIAGPLDLPRLGPR